MNVLLINTIFEQKGKPTIGGVEYHRMERPNFVLKQMHPEFDFIMHNDFNTVDESILNQTDLVIFSRKIAPFDLIKSISNKLIKLNIPFALDLDDYWYLPENHKAYKNYLHFKTSEVVELSIQLSSFVICTTPYLAEKIKPLNENVFIIENGIDSETWIENKSESERLRFGFTQSDTHYEDLKSISADVLKAYKSERFYKDAQVCLTGFTADELYRETISSAQQYERMLTDNFKVIRRDFPDYIYDLKLLRHTDFNEAPYKRVWIQNVFQFHNVYNDIDISIVPLIENTFNSCKSELKMLEAGFKDCAVMVNHVRPYDLLATDKNSFDLNKKTFAEWANILLKNPNRIADSKAQLKEDVKKYDLKILTQKRKELYEKFNFKKQVA